MDVCTYIHICTYVLTVTRARWSGGPGWRSGHDDPSTNSGNDEVGTQWYRRGRASTLLLLLLLPPMPMPRTNAAATALVLVLVPVMARAAAASRQRPRSGVVVASVRATTRVCQASRVRIRPGPCSVRWYLLAALLLLLASLALCLAAAHYYCRTSLGAVVAREEGSRRRCAVRCL